MTLSIEWWWAYQSQIESQFGFSRIREDVASRMASRIKTNDIIIADVAECFNADGSCKSNASVYPTVRSKGLTHLGWEVFR